MADLLLGKPVVDRIGSDLKPRIDALAKRGVVPMLALVRMGGRLDDLSYERTAMRRAESLGIETRPFALDASASTEDVVSLLHQINDFDEIHGCLMFRPLPAHVDEAAVCEALCSDKDIDGITAASLASVFMDGDEGFPPSTAAACMKMLEHYGVSVAGKHIAVIGRSLVVGKPLSLMLLRENATVTMCHSRTENLPEVCRSADIVVCAAGRARAFGSEYFSAGQVVLDVGINFDDEDNLCGDVDFDAVSPLVSAITPVPRGLGSVTTSVTMAHVVEAAERLVGIGSTNEGGNRA